MSRALDRGQQPIAPGALGTGTPGSGNFLRGDGSWQPVDVSGEIALFASGAPGQPRLVGNAVSEFPGTYPVLTVTASDAHSVNNGLGTTVVDGPLNGTTTFVNGTSHTINKYTGSIRFRTITRITWQTGSPANFETRVLKNGVVLQNYTGTLQQAGGTTHVIDISVVPGDVILWQTRWTGGAAESFYTQNGNNTASNGYLVRNLFAPAV